jgi:SAM-dependent methyltransferase
VPPFADHFSSIAGLYAAARPSYPEALFAYLAGLSPRRERAWDCGTGSGQAARGLAAHFREVIATDASPAQLAEAIPDPRISYRVAPAERSGIEPESVDLLTVAQALHWFDLPAFYDEARRVVRPGGAVAIWGYVAATLDDPALTATLHHFHYDIAGPYWPHERAIIESGYRTVPFPCREVAPAAFDMFADWTLADLMDYVRTWSAVRQLIAAGKSEEVPALERALKGSWGDPARRRRVSWPLKLRVGYTED